MQIKIVSPKGGSGGVKYGDAIALMGQNGKYFMIRYSGVVNARTSVLAADTEFKILGGSGPVMVNDRVSFKSEFGFLTGRLLVSVPSIHPPQDPSVIEDAGAVACPALLS